MVAGYTWLVTLWLALADRVPDPGGAQGVMADIYRLAEDAGRAATLAAVSVAAYLVGVLSVAVSSRLLLSPLTGWDPRRLTRRDAQDGALGLPEQPPSPKHRPPALRRARGVGARRDPKRPSPRRHRPSSVGLEVLREAVLDQLDERYRERPEDLAPFLEAASAVAGGGGGLSDPFRRRSLLDACVDVESYRDHLADDLELLPRRLLGEEERELYAEFDRKKAEAEFRAGVALPAAMLVTVLAVRASPWWLLALAVSVLLLVDARRSERSAGDVLAETVRARQLPTPVVTQLRGETIQRRPDEQRMRRIVSGLPSAEAHRALAELLCKSGDDPGARAQLEMAVNLHDPAAMRKLAELSEKSGRDDEAHDYYLQAAHAGDTEAMVALAERLLKEGQLAEAQRWLKEAADKGHAGAALELGRLVEADGDIAQALDLYSRAAQGGAPGAREEWERLKRNR